MMNMERDKKPEWLKIKLPKGADYESVKNLLAGNHLHTVCQEANCPNQFECFSRGTATFMILGDQCSRNCRFCNIKSDPFEKPDPEEPQHVASAALKMKLEYVVVTSVTRDDLPDGGASIFAETIQEIKKGSQKTLVEVLIPDFQGDTAALKSVLDARPDVLNHNVETVPSLYRKVRPQAIYERSLELIRQSKKFAPDIPAKSGVMIGLGESRKELTETFRDLVRHGCDAITIGQYLQPTASHLAVDRFVPPNEFEELKELALGIGFKAVASGPFIRSSYEAFEIYKKIKVNISGSH